MKMKQIKVGTALTVLSLASFAAVAAGDKSGEIAAAPVEREIVRKLGPCRIAKEGAKTVVELEKREYHVARGASTKRDFWISNHTEDFTHPLGLDLRGATNLVIRGNGATIVFHDACVGVAIEDAANVKLENLKLTWSRPIITEGEIVRFDKGATTIRIDPKLFPHRVEKGVIVALGDGWEFSARLAMMFNGKTREIVETTADYVVNGTATANADGTVTIAQDLSVGGKVKVGDVLILRPWSRPYPAVFVYHAKDTVLEDVVVHTAWGMGLIAQMSENVTWRGTRSAWDRTSGCFPPAGSKQITSLHADASHFSNVKGLVTVENCLFETMMDDAVNVHSTCLGIVNVFGPKAIRCRYMHPQATGFGVFNAGDRLRFIRGKTLENDTVTTVTKVETHDSREVTLTLADPLPAGAGVGDAVENADYQSSVVCRGNVIRNNRARGVLFTTPKPIVCESNVFEHVSGAAILFAGDAQGWYESGACEDVIVRGNVFTDCLTTRSFQFCGGIIASWPTIREPKAQKRHYHRNIRIEGNRFNTFDIPLLYARSTDNLVFRNNTLCRNTRYAGWGNGAFDVQACENAVLEPCAKVHGEWQEVWRDDFNGPTLNEKDWSRIGKGGSDWDRHMSPRPDLVTFEKGNLVLWGKANADTNADPRPFLTGGVWTKHKRFFSRGLIEIRAKFEDHQKGAWPAFWTVGDQDSCDPRGWPWNGEIDIVERLNGDPFVYQTAHSVWTFKEKQGQNPPQGGQGKIRQGEYNVYGLEIAPDALVWYVNGEETFRYPRTGASETQWPFTRRQHLKLDQQLGGSWVGKVALETLPVATYIDWVRYLVPKEDR